METLKMINSDHYSVLIIDEVKPDLSGTEVIKRFRQKEKNDRHLQIVFFTGNYYDYETSSKIGADVYLSRPIKSRAVFRVVGGCGGRDVLHMDAINKGLREVIQKTGCRQLAQPEKEVPCLVAQNEFRDANAP